MYRFADGDQRSFHFADPSDTRLCLKTLPSARERAALLSGKAGEAATVETMAMQPNAAGGQMSRSKPGTEFSDKALCQKGRQNERTVDRHRRIGTCFNPEDGQDDEGARESGAAGLYDRLGAAGIA